MAAARPWVSVVSHDSDTAIGGAVNTLPFPDVMRASIRPNIPTEPYQKFSRTMPTLIDFLSTPVADASSPWSRSDLLTLGLAVINILVSQFLSYWEDHRISKLSGLRA
ncbi:hypothetical protein F0562_017950 [Nyssa sinensis]|uniref:Uncharacterized protein n=1 Tax=Nyssa sinensis TaxID=561372 RepID=A0A5J4ZBZ7_9ASTE|nr:hypothetical protein F0562_017950 [Nyssa sinensis]